MRLILIAAFALAACATAVGTAYAPADSKGYGYRETKIESDRYRVSFAGDGATPRAVVEDYALLRAAELADANGYDWFRVVGRDLDVSDRGGVGLGLGVGGVSYGSSSAVGVGVGGDVGNVGGRRYFTARLEVLMGKGAKPEGEDVYDARATIQAIRSRMNAEAE
jgi:hypothetical protein